jgi:hypothetical protein
MGVEISQARERDDHARGEAEPHEQLAEQRQASHAAEPDPDRHQNRERQDAEPDEQLRHGAGARGPEPRGEIDGHGVDQPRELRWQHGNGRRRIEHRQHGHRGWRRKPQQQDAQVAQWIDLDHMGDPFGTRRDHVERDHHGEAEQHDRGIPRAPRHQQDREQRGQRADPGRERESGGRPQQADRAESAPGHRRFAKTADRQCADQEHAGHDQIGVAGFVGMAEKARVAEPADGGDHRQRGRGARRSRAGGAVLRNPAGHGDRHADQHDAGGLKQALVSLQPVQVEQSQNARHHRPVTVVEKQQVVGKRQGQQLRVGPPLVGVQIDDRELQHRCGAEQNARRQDRDLDRDRRTGGQRCSWRGESVDVHGLMRTRVTRADAKGLPPMRIGPALPPRGVAIEPRR